MILIKNLPAKWETLGWEDSLEKEMATDSSILAWGIPWPEEPDRLWSDTTERLPEREPPGKRRTLSA